MLINIAWGPATNKRSGQLLDGKVTLMGSDTITIMEEQRRAARGHEQRGDLLWGTWRAKGHQHTRVLMRVVARLFVSTSGAWRKPD